MTVAFNRHVDLVTSLHCGCTKNVKFQGPQIHFDIVPVLNFLTSFLRIN